MVHDTIIIGSGPAGVHAALPLVEAGKSVLMIDGGKEGPTILSESPSMPFDEMRRTRDDQWKWFLGEDLSSIPLAGLEGGLGGGMMSGNRAYVLDDANDAQPMQTENAQVIQSLAKGGLGAAWGATSAYFSREQIDILGLQGIDLEPYYDAVTKEIGISGPSNKLHVQPALPPDHHVRVMQKKYEEKQTWFKEQKMTLTLPHAAVLTESLGNRKPNPLHDLDYFTDPEGSVYRPKYTIEKLQTYPNFTYLGSHIVRKVNEEEGVVRVHSETMEEKKEMMHEARHVILAAGAVNTARILLKSRNLEGVSVPFVGKPHVFTAALRFGGLGSSGDKNRFSLCQALVIDQNGKNGIEAGSAQLYSYRSLGLFRLINSLPLSTPLALRVAALFSPALIVADIRFPALPGTNTLTLVDNTIRIKMNVSTEEREARKNITRNIHRGLRALGVMPLHTIDLPEGSSSHYAGTVPIEDHPSLPLSVDKDGNLHGAKRISVADASIFRSLPSLPHTLTIMANARRIGALTVASLS